MLRGPMSSAIRAAVRYSIGLICCAVVVACDDPPAPAKPIASATPAIASAPPPPPKESDWTTSPVDPAKGKFTLEQATEGLSGSGKLLADFDTGAGKITCELYDDKAPVTVANFVGLARGVRPYRGRDGKWVKQPAFDNNQFHRVIKKFMIQGGAPQPDGGGDGGYYFADEIWPGATHDRAGLLCMANSGAHTNSMQFFILDGESKYLDKAGHTIFGDCKPLRPIHKIASAKTDNHDHPLDDKVNKVNNNAIYKINKVTIRRASSK